MTRSFAPLLVVLLLTFGAGTTLAADSGAAFVAGIDEVPLMPGLDEVEESEVTFDTAEGRIVVALATGDLTADAVGSFYASTLPAFGWRQDAPNLFRREGEDLTLEFPKDEIPAGKARGVVVKFSLRPSKSVAPSR
ncbi:MAG: hypothetical protein EXQ90_02665 [Rhodospirillales bacterium]|nr:hypothetical protein [Rhodospirillales bacterium]